VPPAAAPLPRDRTRIGGARARHTLDRVAAPAWAPGRWAQRRRSSRSSDRAGA